MDFDYSGPVGCNNFHYAAFYADCQHEIKPVSKGYRLCLIYNLVYRGTGECPAPANNQRIVSTIVSSMREWTGDSNPPPMMTYLLEHQYCEASLTFQLLKNTDRAVARVLSQAKNEVEFDLYLANVNLVENWSASCSYSRYGPQDYTAEDFIDESVTAKNLKSYDGFNVSSIDLDKDYFVPEDFFDDLDPDKEEFEEATGNEGATLDKQYNWAALLVWPSKNRTVNIGIANVVRLLKKDLLGPTLSQEKKAKLDAVAKDIISASSTAFPTEECVSFLQSLQCLDNVELISEFLGVIASSTSVHDRLISNPSFGDEILTIGTKYGWNTLNSLLQVIFGKLSSSHGRIEKYCQFLHRISHQPSPPQRLICQNLARAIVRVLSTEEDTASTSIPTFSYYTGMFSSNTFRGKECVILLCKCLIALECNEQLSTLVQAFCTKPNRYPILDVLAPVCESLLNEGGSENKPLQDLLSYCVSSLEASSARVPSCPADWSERVTFSCSCGDCVALLRFLRNPTETQQRFKMGKGRRQHLHQQLDGNRCSVTHVTEHVGNPHTLVVTKTRSAYKKDVEKFKKEKATLSRLQVLAGTSASSSAKPAVKRQKLGY